MDQFLMDFLDRLFDPFVNPQKRVFLGYLLSALVIAVGVQLIVARATIRKAASELFSRRLWWSPSARADYLVLIINQALMTGIAPRLLSKLIVATLIFETLHVWFDGRPTLWSDAPGWAIAAMFTAAVFLLDDATKYFVHRALHRWPLLWPFHKVHHTAEVLTPFTVYRTHPVEAIISALRSVLVQALAIAVFLFFLGDRTSLVTILGANACLFFFNIAGSNLRHSHVWISYGARIERWLISPAQHQIHHSLEQRHYDRNFGAVLAVWDRLGGSLCVAENNKPAAFGVEGESRARHGLANIYIIPFKEAIGSVASPLSKGQDIMPRRLLWSTRSWLCVCGGVLLAGMLAFAVPAWAGDLNVYSHRQPFLINPFVKAYTEKTGTKVNIVYASKGLAQRLQAEGERSPADVVLTVDIARLHVYADKDLLAEVNSETLQENIPAHLRDPKNRWFSFSKRARIIAVSQPGRGRKEHPNLRGVSGSEVEGPNLFATR